MANMTTIQLAKRLNVEPRTIRRVLHDLLPEHRKGTKWVITLTSK